MAPRSFWKGYLKLSLVTCPVSMTPATSDQKKVRFHTVNRSTGNRVQSRYIDAETGKPVKEDEEVRGFEVEEGKYVLLEDEELEAVALESTRTIDVELFVPRDSVDWIWHDKPHYLAPEGKIADEAFSVIRDAMKATGMVGISRVVLYRRERAVMIEPRGKGIVLWTLRYGDEVRDPEAYFKKDDVEKPDAKHLKLVKTLIGERSKAWSADMVTDPVQDRLIEIIEAKKKKKPAKVKKPKTDAPADKPSNVVSIMDALRKSIESEKKNSK